MMSFILAAILLIASPTGVRTNYDNLQRAYAGVDHTAYGRPITIADRLVLIGLSVDYLRGLEWSLGHDHSAKELRGIIRRRLAGGRNVPGFARGAQRGAAEQCWPWTTSVIPSC